MKLKDTILELIRKTSADLPADIEAALKSAVKAEETGSRARYALDIILEDIALARKRSLPICQDTGSILFFVDHPISFDQLEFEVAAREAVSEATAKGYLRQNSVDPLTGKNSGNNLGPGSPFFHFKQSPSPLPEVRLILKGGGCENVGAQYSLPNRALGADRNIDGAKKCILDAVLKAQGKGCGPGILGISIGGDRATSYLCSKEQLLRRLDDKNPDPRLAKLEDEIVAISNELGIGPMGFGGRTTLLGCKVGMLNRLPASYFVSISYMCWANRRQGIMINNDGNIEKFLY